MLAFVLRCGGVLLTLAFTAVFLPTDSMAAIHTWLGLGAFPAAPITDYLARSISAIYGFHGVLLLIIAADPVRYDPIVRYLGITNILLGLTLLGIDLHAGLPPWWIAVEGPPVMALGVFLLYLRTRAVSSTRRTGL